jgi:hypothetical protein
MNFAPILISFCRRRRLWHCQRPHEIAEIVRQGMELQANRVGDEGAA